jgi:hypothetical protein
MILETKKDGVSRQTEDRIITVLVYLNDVARGDATAFPALNLQVQPREEWHLSSFPQLSTDYWTGWLYTQPCPLLTRSPFRKFGSDNRTTLGSPANDFRRPWEFYASLGAHTVMYYRLTPVEPFVDFEIGNSGFSFATVVLEMLPSARCFLARNRRRVE